MILHAQDVTGCRTPQRAASQMHPRSWLRVLEVTDDEAGQETKRTSRTKRSARKGAPPMIFYELIGLRCSATEPGRTHSSTSWPRRMAGQRAGRWRLDDAEVNG